MRAEQRLGGRVHGGRVQRLEHPPGALLVQRRADRVVQDPVVVRAVHRAESSVKIVRNVAGPTDRHRPRQVTIDAAHPCLRIPPYRAVQVDHLPCGVHPGIGPSGAHDRYRLADERSKRPLNGVLDPRAVLLSLPARESRAVVL